MHIALCHDAIIPPKKYGGTERVIYWLAKALLQLGHKVTLVAKAGSPTLPGADFIEYHENWEETLRTRVDIAHLWATPAKAPKIPFIVTIEGNGQPNERFHANTVFISKKHAENHRASHFVYNGLDPEKYQNHPQKGGYLAFLAKASWSVKNLEGAIAIARKLDLRLEVMGSRDLPLNLHRYLPSIRGIHYRGMVEDAEKQEVLSKARALLFPVRWHEPFGIAVTEALASGCPVLGTPYGSLPEIITSEVGSLALSTNELCNAFTAKKFQPENCVKRVFSGFTHLQMAQNYLPLYSKVIEFNSLLESKTTAPQTLDIPGLSSKALLPWSNQ